MRTLQISFPKAEGCPSATAQFRSHRARRRGFLLAITGWLCDRAVAEPKSAQFSTRWYRSTLDTATEMSNKFC